MPRGSPVAGAHRLLVEAVDALAESGTATDAELPSALTVCEGITRQAGGLTLAAISTLRRRDTFAEPG